MTTVQQLGDYYHDSRYSPPVSPRSLPHGCKRKASAQDDEVERQNVISNSFKKLRLNNAKRASAIDLPPPVGIAYRDLNRQQPSPSHQDGVPGRDMAYRPDALDEHDSGMMSVDDTTDRVWIHDLDAEIAEIEAEEARAQSGIQLTEAGKESSKIPQYLLNLNTTPDEGQSNMQMILYRDPISISVPEEHDAVRKTIVEARRRMREKQAEERQKESPLPSILGPINSSRDDEDDRMDID